MSFKAAFVTFALWVVTALAQDLTITEPSSERWWVAQSQNTLRWNCEQTKYTNWTVLATNSDPTILSGPLALIAIREWNYDCSKTMIPGEQLKPGTGYVMSFANPLNNTDVWASSQPFEVKAVGSTYPPQITTSQSPAGGSGPTGSSGSSAPSPTSTPNSSGSNGAMANSIGIASLIFVGVVSLLFAA